MIGPVFLFMLGLCCTGVSLALAKHRELRRVKEAFDGNFPPDFNKPILRSQTWDCKPRSARWRSASRFNVVVVCRYFNRRLNHA
jgi:hypothetical protein